VHLALVYALVAIALWRRPRGARGVRDLVVLAVTLAAYLAVLSSGPEAYPRFRAPIAPLLAILAGLGAQRLWSSARAAGGRIGGWNSSPVRRADRISRTSSLLGWAVVKNRLPACSRWS
jgi:hypothetical protein